MLVASAASKSDWQSISPDKDNSMKTFKMTGMLQIVTFYFVLVIALFISLVACCYVCAGLQFLILRYVIPETEERFRRFLPRYHQLFADNMTAGSAGYARQQLGLIRKNAKLLFPLSFLLTLHCLPIYLGALLASIFVGNQIACAWYGSRCAQKLDVVAFPMHH